MSNKTLPRLGLVATGGTILGVQTARNEKAYTAGTLSVNQLLSAVPQVNQLASFQIEQIANIGSQDMSYEIWLMLAKRINTLCEDPAIDGIVIVHGTDTLEETAYFLSLVIHYPKPIVLTGAMRPATALGAEGPANLYHSIRLAVHPSSWGQGPLVVINEDIHYAREVQKNSCSGLNAFISSHRGCAGVMHQMQPVFYGKNTRYQGEESKFSVENLTAAQLPRVEIVNAYVGANEDWIYFLIEKAKGIILAGVGQGNTSEAMIKALAYAANQGTVVVRASRTLRGYIERNLEMDDDQLGFITAGDLSVYKSRILLMLALLQTQDRKTLQFYFDHY